MINRISSLLFICRCLSPHGGLHEREALRGEILSGSVNWEHVVEMANQKLVFPSLWSALSRKGLVEVLPDDLREYLEELHRLNKLRNRSLKHQAETFIRHLNHEDVEPILLKGIACLFTDIYPDAGARFMGDLDILVRPEAACKTTRTLLSLGYGPAEKDPEIYKFAQHLIPFVKPSEKAPVEVHTRIVSELEPQILTLEDAWRDSTVVSSDGLNFRLLSHSHAVLYNLIHSEIHHLGFDSGAIFLKGFYDFVLLELRYGEALDWAHILSLMKEHGLGNVLRSYVYTASRLFGTQAPRILAPGHSTRIHYRRRLRHVRSGRMMYCAGRWALLRHLFSARRISVLMGCGTNLPGLTKGRARYVIYLLKRYVFGNGRHVLLDNLRLRKKGGSFSGQ